MDGGSDARKREKSLEKGEPLMPRSTQDGLDVNLTIWARERKIMLGIPDARGVSATNWIEPRERIGKLRSTLAQSKDERQLTQDSAALTDTGLRSQSWPDTYRGIALIMHQAIMLLPPKRQHAIELRYVRTDLDWAEKAREMGVSRAQYVIELGLAKEFLWGHLGQIPGMTMSRKSEGFQHPNASKYEPHQGAKETARRRGQKSSSD